MVINLEKQNQQYHASYKELNAPNSAIVVKKHNPAPFAADRLCPSALLRCVFVYENLKVKHNEKEI